MCVITFPAAPSEKDLPGDRRVAGGRPCARPRRAWRLIATGAFLSAAGALLLSAADTDRSYPAAMLPALVLSGLGFGLMFASVVIVAMRGAQPHEAGVISGLTSTMQQVGGAVSVAFLVTVASRREAGHVSVDPRTGFTVLTVFLVATALTALVIAVRGHRAAGSQQSREATAA